MQVDVFLFQEERQCFFAFPSLDALTLTLESPQTLGNQTAYKKTIRTTLYTSLKDRFFMVSTHYAGVHATDTFHLLYMWCPKRPLRKGSC